MMRNPAGLKFVTYVTPLPGRALGHLNFSSLERYIPGMRALCVGRHQFLSEHLGRFFESLGLDCTSCVGLAHAMELVPMQQPDVVICDYDLLATMPLANWESDPVLADVPIIAVSLTRHPGEAHLMDVNGIAGFLYLPTLEPRHAHRIFSALRSRSAPINPPNVLQWPAPSQAPQLR